MKPEKFATVKEAREYLERVIKKTWPEIVPEDFTIRLCLDHSSWVVGTIKDLLEVTP